MKQDNSFSDETNKQALEISRQLLQIQTQQLEEARNQTSATRNMSAEIGRGSQGGSSAGPGYNANINSQMYAGGIMGQGGGGDASSPYSIYSSGIVSSAANNGIYIHPQQQQFQSNIIQGSAEASQIKSQLFPNRSRMDGRTSDAVSQHAAHRMTNAVGAVGGEAAGLLGGLAGSAAFGILGGMTGGYVAGKIAAIPFEQNKVTQGYKEYLTQNSYKFINSGESTNDRGVAGFGRNDNFQAAEYLRKVNTDFHMKDEEVGGLLQSFTDMDMLKSTSDLDTFKEKFSKLLGTVKTSAIIMNESYEEVSKMMGEMERLGIGAENFDAQASKLKAIGNLSGKSAGDVFNATNNYAQNLVAGTALDGTQQFNNMADDQYIMSHMYSRLQQKVEKGESSKDEKHLYNYIKNQGGEEQAAQTMANVRHAVLKDEMVSIGAAAYFNLEDGDFVFNKDSVAANKGLSQKELVAKATNRMNSWSTEDSMRFLSAKDNLLMGLDTTSQNSIIDSFTTSFGRENGIGADSVLSDVIGLDYDTAKAYRMSSEIMQKEGTQMLDAFAMQSARENMIAQEREKLIPLSQRFGNWMETQDQKIGDAFTPSMNWMSNTLQDFSGKLGGYDAVSVRELTKTYGGLDNMGDFTREEVIAAISTSEGDHQKLKEALGLHGSSISKEVAKTALDVSASGLGLSDRKTPDTDGHKTLKEMLEDPSATGMLLERGATMLGKKGDENMAKILGIDPDNKDALKWGALANYNEITDILSDKNQLSKLSDTEIISAEGMAMGYHDFFSTRGVDMGGKYKLKGIDGLSNPSDFFSDKFLESFENGTDGMSSSMFFENDPNAMSTEMFRKVAGKAFREDPTTRVGTSGGTTVGDARKNTADNKAGIEKIMSGFREQSEAQYRTAVDSGAEKKILIQAKATYQKVMDGAMTPEDGDAELKKITKEAKESGNQETIDAVKGMWDLTDETEAKKKEIEVIGASDEGIVDDADHVVNMAGLYKQAANMLGGNNLVRKVEQSHSIESGKTGWFGKKKKYNIRDLTDIKNVNNLAADQQKGLILDIQDSSEKTLLANLSQKDINKGIAKMGLEDQFTGWAGEDGAANEQEREAAIRKLVKKLNNEETSNKDLKSGEIEFGKGMADDMAKTSEVMGAYTEKSAEFRQAMIADTGAMQSDIDAIKAGKPGLNNSKNFGWRY